MWASVDTLAVVPADGRDGHKKSEKDGQIREGNIFPICHSWDSYCLSAYESL